MAGWSAVQRARLPPTDDALDHDRVVIECHLALREELARGGAIHLGRYQAAVKQALIPFEGSDAAFIPQGDVALFVHDRAAKGPDPGNEVLQAVQRGHAGVGNDLRVVGLDLLQGGFKFGDGRGGLSDASRFENLLVGDEADRTGRPGQTILHAVHLPAAQASFGVAAAFDVGAEVHQFALSLIHISEPTRPY